MDKGDLLFNKRGLKGTHLNHICPNKEVYIGQHNRGKLSYLLWEMNMTWYLPEVPTHADCGGGRGELEVCMQLQGYDLTGITQT